MIDWVGRFLLSGSSPQPLSDQDKSRCNTLQRTTRHCNTLQHSATHCKTLQHSPSHRYPPIKTYQCVSDSLSFSPTPRESDPSKYLYFRQKSPVFYQKSREKQTERPHCHASRTTTHCNSDRCGNAWNNRPMTNVEHVALVVGL